ncbi:MAG TPA: SUMF1/EgtB/PvdO family nonheme iron enzyme [Bryobacteraceae bacterium]|jgi:formylglycine-generating enzyme required for sulfatase activity|nr:SUMF1/EgtB/PvdO family nonheme iron enzyme [Bryobacteraceae bacterium]
MDTPLPRQLAEARLQTDNLFPIVRADSLYERPIPERHRIIFYLGHLEAFDWNLVAQYALDMPSFHPTFDRLFAFGIDPSEGDLPDDKPSDWPSVEEVRCYNQRTREVIDEALPNVPEEMVNAAIEHRLMHAETLAYILHQLPFERKVAQVDGLAHGIAPRPRMIEIPAGIAELGLRSGEGFGWDNEYEACAVEVPAFSLGKYKVTNGEYLEFVRAGGAAPFFWRESGGEWFYRGMFQEVPLPLNSPVYVTKCQAEAYAAWRRSALPTEAQFHRAADGLPLSRNLDFRYWDPIPVTADDEGNGSDPLAPAQMTGNGWEWTSSLFSPFPGFAPLPYYTNYSAPFFDGQHYVLKGASPRTARRFARPSFRNWFRPSYPYIYATFRMVQS